MATIHGRITNVLLALVLLALLAVLGMLASGVRSGELDPDNPPASTMKSLDEIPGSWSRMLPADDGAPGPDPPAGCDSSRFDCLEDFFNDLVLDRETGLVWQRDAVNYTATVSWANAHTECMTTRYGGVLGYRLGWRLATFEELQSLVEHFVGPPPLPPGHPFIVNTDNFYWTATSSSATTAWAFRFDGTVGTNSADPPKTNEYYYWCVRGGQGYDGM